MNKALSWALVIVIITIAGGFSWHWYTNRAGQPQVGPQFEIYRFDGTIEKNESGILTLKGHYSAANHPELQSGKEVEVRVTITPQTPVIKTITYLPAPQEAATANTSYDLGELEHEQMISSLNDIGSNVITVTTAENIYHKTFFTAKQIDYYVEIVGSPKK